MPTHAPTPQLDRVPLHEKAALGVGSLSMFFGFAGISILAYPVYNMLLGVDAGWVALALVLPRLWDAVTDPVMGKLSDNFRSRWGRRRPFIVAGAAAMGVAFALLWQAPASWSGGAQMAYFVAMQLVFFTCFTVFAVPFNALTYEMTPDYRERTRVMAWLAFFHKCGEFLGGWMLPLAAGLSVALVASADDLNMTGVQAMAWILGLVVLAGLGMLPGLLVRERQAVATRRQSSVKLWAGVKAACSNPPFLILIAVIVLNTLSGVLASGLDQYLLVYFMNDGNKADGLLQKGMLSSGYAVVGFASIPVITFIANRLGKKAALYFVYGLMVAGGVAKWFIFQPGHAIYDIAGVKLDPILMIDPLLCGPMWVAVKILLASMMADICDEDERRHGQRREGLFGAVFSWLEKLVVSAAYVSTGLALTIAAFDVELGAQQAPETFTKMRLFLAGGPAITAVFAIVALYFYPIDAARAAETRDILEKRRGAVHARPGAPPDDPGDGEGRPSTPGQTL
ncbi:MAG: MFS transporter [Planctomycetota bacterium]